MATPNAEIFIGNEPRVTFGALFEDAEALAVSFGDLGLHAGDRISFQIPNWHEAAAINLAAAMAGLVVVPIVPIYRDAEMRQMLADSGCRLLFLAEQFRGFDYAAMAERIQPDLPSLETVIFVRGSDPARSYEALVECGRGRSLGGWAASPNAVKIILYTSGTTGTPKGVLHSQNTLNNALDMCIRQWRIQEGEVLLMPSPVTHLTGYGYLEMPLLTGAKTLLMEQWNAEEAADLIEKYDVVGTISATPFLKELADCAERRGTGLPSLRFFACGGAAVPPSIIRHANTVLDRAPAFRVFGCTEAPLITMGFHGADEHELAATTDGKIEDYKVRIVDEDGNELAAGEEGEILARGPAMLLGYFDPLQTEEAITDDGFYKTGDLGILTPENAVLITGRKKDLIIRGGENISAKEIEDLLYRHPAIEDAAVVAMPHARLGEGVCAVVVLRPDAELSRANLAEFISQSGLAKQKWPERIELVDQLPKTATGKVRKDVLRSEIARAIATDRPLSL
ncbi:AMP-binding protein [Parasphingopyxis sp. GrpM-11]|uniref:3-methylmercaptopropionyl-CoA ligase n=2 Tax=Parasphingopyxis marina TaxID=2761622 RepID=A0A842I2H7_9SPHN|nr:AMP-binding protein [Parasphingopyxis marina]